MDFNIRKILTVSSEQVLRTMSARQWMFNFRGRGFKVTVYEVTLKTFKKLGLNPKAFAPGAQIYVMEKQVYKDFCELITKEAAQTPPLPSRPAKKRIIDIPIKESEPGKATKFESASGTYPLPRVGELDAIRRGETPFLPDRSRVIILPKNFTRLDLTHELIHDIFFSRRFSVEMRRDFILFVVYGVRASYLKNPSPDLKFYEEVNQCCNITYQIEALKKLNLLSIGSDTEIGPNLFNYAQECFVYAFEILLKFKDPALGNLPEDLRLYLTKFPIV